MHLYAAFLGGELAAGRMGEDHEVVFVVADDEVSARRAAKKKWGGDGRPHVDALTRIDKVDGFAVALDEDGGDSSGSGDSMVTVGYNE